MRMTPSDTPTPIPLRGAGQRNTDIGLRVMRQLIALYLLMAVPLAAAQMTDNELSRREAFDAWLYEPFADQNLQTVQDIRSLGPPIREVQHEYVSPHATPDLEMREFVFDGLTVYAIIEQAVTSRVWLSQIQIARSSWPLKNGLSVGQPISVLARLPVQPEPGALKVCGVNHCLVAEEKEGRIR